jgi:diguanylate cyclase (GGDEF)-like protein/PAS domain S-box-containing protein
MTARLDSDVTPVTVAGVVRRGWPFVAVAAGAVALQPFTGGEVYAEWWWAGILVAVVGIVGVGAAVLGRLRAGWETVGGLLSLAGIVLLRHASHGTTSGFGALVLLPIVWFSLFGSRRQLITVICAASVALTAPLLLIGGERYPTTAWRLALILIGVGLLSGLSSQRLRDRLAARTDDAASLAGDLHDALEAMSDPVGRYEVVRDGSGVPIDLRCVLLNAAGRQMMGAESVGELLSERLRQRGRSEMLDVWLSAVDSVEPISYELTSDHWRHGRIVALQLVRIHNGVLASWRDVTNERAAESSLRQSIDRWHSMADAATDASLIVDHNFDVIHVSLSIADMLGLDQTSAIGQSALRIVHPDDRSLVFATMTAALHDDARRTIEFRARDQRSPSEYVWLEGRAAGLGAGTNRELNIGLRNITSARLERAALGHQATHDPLTGLLNRAGLQASLDSQTDRAADLHLLYIDLDRFKPINDDHGHQAGDQVLVTVAQRLIATLRADDAAARIGGDEFAIISHVSDADKLIARLTAAIAAPITLTNNAVVYVTASVGLASASANTTIDDLLIEADIEMYRNKRRAQVAHREH